MPWSARLHPEFAVVETRYFGKLTQAELAEAIRETEALATRSGRTRLLGDCTDLEGGHSVADLYFFADAIAATEQAQKVREAVLLPSLPAPAEHVRFWETTCANRGLAVRIFDQREEALRWLLG